MAQTHLDTLERPLFSVRVHAKRHAGTRPERCQKQFVRIRSPIITPIGRFVRLEAVLSNSYRLKKTLALRIYDDSSGHTSRTVHQGRYAIFNPPTARYAPKIAHAEFASVFCQSRSWVTQFQRTRFASALCNWPTRACNGR